MNNRQGWWFVFSLLAATCATAAENQTGASSIRIDEIIEAECNSAGATLAPVCDDATFLRRVWLDVAGQIPPAIAARDFLQDNSTGKRARLVDQLLASDDFADHWGRVLTERFTDKRALPEPPYNGRVLHAYLRDSLAEDRPYRQIVRELIVGEGANDVSGPANFLLRYQVEPVQLAGAVANKFLGQSLACAQCHDHPFDHWTRDDFWGLAACFARARQMNSNDGQFFAVMEARRGELEIDAFVPAAAKSEAAEESAAGEQPAEEQPAAPPEKRQVQPRLLDGTLLAADKSRRAALADWVCSSDNADFAREAVNFVWARLFSHRLSAAQGAGTHIGPAFESELHDAIASAFIADSHRLKKLLRSVVLSRAYARDSAASPSNDGTSAGGAAASPHSFALHVARPLTVDELYRSLVQIGGYAGGYEDMEGQPGDPESDPNSTSDPAVELLTARSLSVQRSLALLNSDYVRQVSRMGARLCRAAVGQRIAPGHVEYAFLATLSRRPTDEESKTMLQLVKASQSPTKGLEDLFWLLLNSAEFNVNH